MEILPAGAVAHEFLARPCSDRRPLPVACALVSIKHLYDKIDFEILFDDYGDRPHYHPIEQFARLHAMHGRMAVFKQKRISIGDLDAAIARFSTDYR